MAWSSALLIGRFGFSDGEKVTGLLQAVMIAVNTSHLVCRFIFVAPIVFVGQKIICFILGLIWLFPEITKNPTNYFGYCGSI